MNTKVSNSRFDFHSIRFKLWRYFIAFSLILITLIGLLQIFFLNAYYEEMKMQETDKIAKQLRGAFRDDHSLQKLNAKINSITATNDTYIRIETNTGDVVAAPFNDGHNQFYFYGPQAKELRIKLLNSQFKSVSKITANSRGTRTLSYACYLYKARESEGMPNEKSYILYLFSPLYPVKSTIAILRIQLVYIAIIAVILGMSISLYLANHISKPIQEITESAAEMGRGNYSVNFQGGGFTELDDLSDTLRNASRKLEKTANYQKDLIANVSHDLKTPLTMIKSYAEMIRDLSGDNAVKRTEHLNVIIEETDRLNTLVNDMLNMTKLQSGKIKLDRHNFNLSKALLLILASYDVLQENDGYKIYHSVEPNLLVYGDEAKIKQVISNLIGNAVKYCGEDKKIYITLKKQDNTALFSVEDHGMGISKDEIGHVWERYYKTSANHVRPTEGTGLGLSIVKEILDLHKAKYGVNSTLGKGSTFWFKTGLARGEKIKKQAK